MSFETTTDEVLAGVDLRGRVALVTGASAGLGVETARALASVGASVVLAGRDEERLRQATEAIRSQVPGSAVEGRVLDLASLASVRSFADWFASAHDRLHLLINNAGVMYTPFERTAEGFEVQFATNHLGHFLLTGLLVPQLLADPPARVVNLSSGAHWTSDILWDDVNFERTPYDKFAAYGQSKTANVLFTVELDRRLGAHGVHAYAVHPGSIETDLGRYMTDDDFAKLTSQIPADKLPQYKTVEQGAATSVWAATAPELDSHGGAYLADAEISRECARWARDPASAIRLWSLSEELVGERFDF